MRNVNTIIPRIIQLMKSLNILTLYQKTQVFKFINDVDLTMYTC